MTSVVMATSGMTERAAATSRANEPRRGLARHAAQRGGAAGLQRQVQVAAQARVFPQPEEVLIQVPGLQRRQAQAGRVGVLEDSLDQVPQMQTAGQILAPGAQVDAGEHDLVGVGGSLDIRQDLGDGCGCARRRAAGW